VAAVIAGDPVTPVGGVASTCELGDADAGVAALGRQADAVQPPRQHRQ